MKSAPPARPELDDLTFARAQRSEPRALAALVRHYEGLVYAVVGRLLVARPSAIDDVAQESFLKILRHLPRFDPHGAATLSTWIVTITTRTCIDALRKPMRMTRDDEALWGAKSEAHGPDEVTQGHQLERALHRAMAELPDDQRAVLVLRAFHDLDYFEIARALEIEEGTVKSRLSRARAALKRVLEGSEVRDDV